MCDTFVAPPSFTKGTMILEKNSDREPNEARAIIRFSPGGQIYAEISIPSISLSSSGGK